MNLPTKRKSLKRKSKRRGARWRNKPKRSAKSSAERKRKRAERPKGRIAGGIGVRIEDGTEVKKGKGIGIGAWIGTGTKGATWTLEMLDDVRPPRHLAIIDIGETATADPEQA